MSRDLRIRVRTIGTEATRAAIRSITRETQQSTARQRQASRGRLTDEQAARLPEVLVWLLRQQ